MAVITQDPVAPATATDIQRILKRVVPMAAALAVKNPGALSGEMRTMIDRQKTDIANILDGLPGGAKLVFGYRGGIDYPFTKDPDGNFSPAPALGKQVSDVPRDAEKMAGFILATSQTAEMKPFHISVAAPVAAAPAPAAQPPTLAEMLAKSAQDMKTADRAVDAAVRQKPADAAPAPAPQTLDTNGAQTVAAGFLAFFNEQHHGHGIQNYKQIDVEDFISAAPGTYGKLDLTNASPALKDKIREAWGEFREAISEPVSGNFVNGGRDIAVAAAVRALEKSGTASLPAAAARTTDVNVESAAVPAGATPVASADLDPDGTIRSGRSGGSVRSALSLSSGPAIAVSFNPETGKWMAPGRVPLNAEGSPRSLDGTAVAFLGKRLDVAAQPFNISSTMGIAPPSHAAAPAPV